MCVYISYIRNSPHLYNRKSSAIQKNIFIFSTEYVDYMRASYSVKDYDVRNRKIGISHFDRRESETK